MNMIGYLKFAEKMWYAPLIWAGISGKLAYDFVRSPSTFWPRNRAATPIDTQDDPVDGLSHRTLAGANGVKIHTVTTGEKDKPLMLLLHGFPELWTMWEHQIRAFRDSYNVAAIDMRGYGRSDRPTAWKDYYIDMLVADVVAVVHALGYKKCVLGGHDWGGKVAWTVAHMHQDMIERLVIVSAPHPTSWTENFSLRQSIKCDALSLKGTRSSYFQLFYAPWLAEVFVLHHDVSLIDMSLVYGKDEHAPCNPKAVSDPEIQLIKNSMCQGINASNGISSASAMLNYYRGWVDNETWRPIESNCDWRCEKKLQVPTMLLVGKHDMYFYPEMWQHLDSHAQNCWVPGMLENCSHWCPQDSPEAVNEHIQKFLGKEVDGFQKEPGAPGDPEM